MLSEHFWAIHIVAGFFAVAGAVVIVPAVAAFIAMMVDIAQGKNPFE